MKVIKNHIPGLLVIEPKVFEDSRGYFFESYQREKLEAQGFPKVDFVQDNQSRSTKGVLRGLHYQLNDMAQAKLVSVFVGKVLDVAVDIRKGSPTYGQWHGEILSAENHKQLFIPRGFAHGFVVLSDEAEFFYKCDNYYSKEHEGGIRFDDPALSIDWQMDTSQVLLSDKDKELPLLEDADNNFEYKPE